MRSCLVLLTPEQYVREITIANDGIVYQKAILAYAQRSFDMIGELDRWGVKFLKDENGDYDVKKVHHRRLCAAHAGGRKRQEILYRRLRQAQVLISNRFVATRLLKALDGRIAGAILLNSRTADVHVIRAKAVILAAGAAGRLGLPASGYLWGTYENPTNSGDGHAMAYHVGAELTNLECFQINPLIKDYNGPACAYVAGPFGAYTANNQGKRFIECDYWSGQMMLEFYRELQSGNGPVFLKFDHLRVPETVSEIENILHKVERPSRGQFHENRGTDYRRDMVEMHISDGILFRPQRLGRVGGRTWAHHRAGPLRCRRHGERAPQLYARRIRQRRHRRRGRCGVFRLCAAGGFRRRRGRRPSGSVCWRRCATTTDCPPIRSSTRYAVSSMIICNRRR